MGTRQPRVSAGLQRRVRVRRVHQRRRGRRLLLATSGRRPRTRWARGPNHQRPSFFLPGQGWPCRRSTAPVDHARPAAPQCRPEVAEEDEAPGGEADGAVPVGREHRPSPGDGVAAEGLHGAVQGERQTRDKVGAFFLLDQAEEGRCRRGGAATKEAAASRWRLRAPRPQLSGAGCRRSTGGGSLMAPTSTFRWRRLTANLTSLLTMCIGEEAEGAISDRAWRVAREEEEPAGLITIADKLFFLLSSSRFYRSLLLLYQCSSSFRHATWFV